MSALNARANVNDDVFDRLSQCARLTSEYLYLVPQHGYQYEKVKPIIDTHSLKEQYTNLNTLLEVQMASKVLAGAQYRAKGQWLLQLFLAVFDV